MEGGDRQTFILEWQISMTMRLRANSRPVLQGALRSSQGRLALLRQASARNSAFVPIRDSFFLVLPCLPLFENWVARWPCQC